MPFESVLRPYIRGTHAILTIALNLYEQKRIQDWLAPYEAKQSDAPSGPEKQIADIFLREFLIEQGLLDEALDFVQRTTILPINEKHAYGVIIAQRKGKIVKCKVTVVVICWWNRFSGDWIILSVCNTDGLLLSAGQMHVATRISSGAAAGDDRKEVAPSSNPNPPENTSLQRFSGVLSVLTKLLANSRVSRSFLALCQRVYNSLPVSPDPQWKGYAHLLGQETTWVYQFADTIHLLFFDFVFRGGLTIQYFAFLLQAVCSQDPESSFSANWCHHRCVHAFAQVR